MGEAEETEEELVVAVVLVVLWDVANVTATEVRSAPPVAIALITGGSSPPSHVSASWRSDVENAGQETASAAPHGEKKRGLEKEHAPWLQGSRPSQPTHKAGAFELLQRETAQVFAPHATRVTVPVDAVVSSKDAVITPSALASVHVTVV
jgi:hypothetical protein